MSALVDRAHGRDRSDRMLGPLGAGLALVGLLMIAASCYIWSRSSPGWGYDFAAYFDAAQRMLATGSPYQVHTLGGPFQPGPYGLYLYAPPLALLFVPLVAMGASTGLLVWLALRIALLVATCALLPIPRPWRLVMFGVAALSAPFLVDLDLGNVSLIVTFFAVVVWRWLDTPLGGLGLAASLPIRPTMGVIWIWWLIRRQWRAAMWTAIGLAAIALATLPFTGIDMWFQYLTVLRNVSNVMGVTRNLDLGSTALSLGLTSEAGVVMLYLGYVVAIGAIAVSLRRDREISYAVTLMATLLLSPLLWDHYLTMLIVPAALLAARGRRWGVLLPLLGWLPLVFLPFVATAGMLLPFLAPERGRASLEVGRDEPEAVADIDPSLSGTAGA